MSSDDEVTVDIMVDTTDEALEALESRLVKTRTFFSGMLQGDSLIIPPAQAVDMLLHLSMNQCTIMEALKVLLAEVKKNENV